MVMATTTTQTSITMKELRMNLAEYVNRAQSGETIVVTRNGFKVAVLGPTRNSNVADDVNDRAHWDNSPTPAPAA